MILEAEYDDCILLCVLKNRIGLVAGKAEYIWLILTICECSTRSVQFTSLGSTVTMPM